MMSLTALVFAAPSDAPAGIPVLSLIVGLIVVALAGVAVWLFKRSRAEDSGRDYDGRNFDPAAAARKLAERPVVELAPEDAEVAEDAPLVVEPVMDEALAAPLSEPVDDAEELHAELSAVQKKEAFAAAKVEKAAEREARRQERLEEAEQAAVAYREELEKDRQDFAEQRRTAYRTGLTRTRQGLMGKIGGIFSGGRGLDESAIDDLEAVLFTSDIGVRTADRLIGTLRERFKAQRVGDLDDVFHLLREEIADVINLPQPPLFGGGTPEAPQVVMVVGVNGVGKTTTIGKLAHRAAAEGHVITMGAGDTFRAAAVEQLGVWAERTGATLIDGADQADPSSVLFRAVEAGRGNGSSVIICDTAGRLHTKDELMAELKKMHRVIGKAMPDAPHEVILVLDATVGQNAIAQAKRFAAEVPLTGIILTKLDGTARGGVIAGICDELKVPVRFIGIGESLDDLRPFDAQAFVDALFDRAAADVL
jgi:fused signal recognition particle receptor